MKKNSPTCTCGEIRPLIHEVFPVKDDADLLRISRQGNAPKYYRTGSQRQTPAVFLKSDWLAFAKQRWGCLRPDLIQQMIDAGFEPDPAPNMVKKNKAKTKAKKALS